MVMPLIMVVLFFLFIAIVLLGARGMVFVVNKGVGLADVMLLHVAVLLSISGVHMGHI